MAHKATAFSEAFRAAGVVDPKERLREIGIAAMQASPGNWDGAMDALYKGIKGDAALLWELFASVRREVAKNFLTELNAEIRQETKLSQATASASSAPGHGHRDNQPTSARRADVPVSGGWGQERCDDQSTSAPPIRKLPEKTRRPYLSADETRAMLRATNDTARKSLLDTFEVNRQPLGKVTVREARGFGNKLSRDGRFLFLLTANLENADDMLVGRCCGPEDAASAMRLANAEFRNA